MSRPDRSKFLRRRAVDAAFLSLVAFVWSEGREGAGSTRLDDPRFEGIRFVESAAAKGIEFAHESTALDPKLAGLEPMIAGIGAAVSVCDPNGDGWPDLYATTSAHGKPNALYVNRGDGTFDERAEEAGLADVNRAGEGCSMGSVWADWNNDGRQDLFVYKWGRCQLFENLGDLRFRDATEGSGLDAWINSNGATWFDYDKDGLLDLYVTGYFSEEHDLWNVGTTRVMHDSFEFAQNGGRNRLYHNLGDGRFEDVTEALGADSRKWTLAVGAADLDRDGWTDLYLANDYGAEELLRNVEGKRFERMQDIGLEYESKSGMCVAFGNLSNDGRHAIFVTNISAMGFVFQGNNLRVNYLADGAGMMQRAHGAVADCGWAWGAQFGDLDGDGWQDLFVTNGFVSANTERSYWYQMTKVAGATGELLEDVNNWPAMEDRSLSGFERSRVLFHAGKKSAQYREGGLQVGIDDVYDGRAVALSDLDRDGDLDIVVANQDGPLLVYDNRTELEHHWLGFELTAAEGNREALASEVRVVSSVGEQVQVVTAASGFASQNERRLHFGLGSDPGPVTVHVRWASGAEQTFEPTELDVTLSLLEASR